MKKLVLFILMILACRITMLSAGESLFPVIDWQDMKSDTLLPYYGTKLQLDGDYADSLYSVEIEYPELEKLSKADADRWRLSIKNIPQWPVIDTHISVSVKKANLEIGFIPLIYRDGSYYAIKSCKLNVNATATPKAARAMAQAGQSTESRYADNSVLSTGKWVKIAVLSTGVYKLSDKFLASVGFKNPSKVRLYGYGGAVLPETGLHNLTDDLPEQPLWREKGYMLFYAQGPISWSRNYNGEYLHSENSYSDYGYYFLTETDTLPAFGMDVEQTDSLISKELLDTYPEYALYEADGYSWYHSGRTFYDTDASPVRNVLLETPNMVDGEAVLRVRYAANASENSYLQVNYNGNLLDNKYIPRIGDNDAAKTVESVKSFDAVGADKSVIKLEYSAPAGAEGRIDYVSFTYNRKLVMQNNFMAFRTGAMKYAVSMQLENATSDIIIWRRSADGECTIIPSEYNDGVLTTYSSNIKSNDELIAVKRNANFPEPQVVDNVSNQNLHSLGHTDMVILVPQSGKLTAQAERLAELHRDADGLNVAVVRADMVYNEFSSGTPDATAYRRFMKMLYDKAEPGKEPRYLLLFGDGAWDNRMKTSEWRGENPHDYLLCYESENSESKVSSYVMEDYFGLLDDTEGYNLLKDRPDLGIGRLPAITEAQAKAMVDKIVAYSGRKYAGDWKNSILMLGDDGDNNIHMRDADNVAEKIAATDSSLYVNKIYWDSYKMEVTASGNSYPTVRKELLEQLQTGALLVNYSGHGSADVLSHELVLNKGDMSALVSSATPFWITASCDIAPFDSPLENIGENLILNGKGGAVGLLTTTRTVYASMNYRMNTLYTEYLLKRDNNGQANTVGDALRLAKNDIIAGTDDIQDLTENKLHFVLLGDPALKLALPEYTVVVDSFNHKSAHIEGHSAQAGAIVSVSGHIEDALGNKITTNGIIYPKVFDNEREVTTLNNAAATNPFTYKTRDRILYSGSDSVVGGEFSFSFPVPLDINYSDKNGQILLYAELDNGQKSANGNFSNFIVGGTAENIETDSVGPQIKMYLNTPEFRYGADVNRTPMFVADVYDIDGLNSSGNGLGHDILISIDNNPLYQYVVNSYFTSVTGDYTRGRVVFELPELPVGKHTLMFRVWDIKNNSSTAYLAFNVVDGLKPVLSVTPMENPASESTTFVVEHDRPAENVSVTLKVVSTDGKEVWGTSAEDASRSGICLVNWNLADTKGSKVSPGLYLVYAILEDENGAQRKAVNKLIIVSR